MDTEIRVSTESRPWRRKFSRRSSRDLNPRPFNHESGALTTELSPPLCILIYLCLHLYYIDKAKQCIFDDSRPFFHIIICIVYLFPTIPDLVIFVCLPESHRHQKPVSSVLACSLCHHVFLQRCFPVHGRCKVYVQSRTCLYYLILF